MEIKTTEEIQKISTGIYKEGHPLYMGHKYEELVGFDEEKKRKKWISVDDLEKFCLGKLSEEPTKYLQGDWNEAFKIILKKLDREPEPFDKEPLPEPVELVTIDRDLIQRMRLEGRGDEATELLNAWREGNKKQKIQDKKTLEKRERVLRKHYGMCANKGCDGEATKGVLCDKCYAYKKDWRKKNESNN